jgi:hypothetical protein
VNWKNQRNLVLTLGLAGFVSSLLVICGYHLSGRMGFDYFPGVVFGTTIATAFAILGRLRGSWRALGIAAASTWAWGVSQRVAVAVEVYWPYWKNDREVSRPALFVAGTVGACLVLGAVLLLVGSGTPQRGLLLKILCGSLIGGLLGIVGWILGPYLGMVAWVIVHSMGLTAPTESFQNALHLGTTNAFSLFVVWQTGTSLLLGFLTDSQGQQVEPT